MARNKYTFYSAVAKNQGYEQIADLFLKTAENERSHAYMWFKELNGVGDLLKIFYMQQRAKITNGLICIISSLKRQKKKVSLNLP